MSGPGEQLLVEKVFSFSPIHFMKQASADTGKIARSAGTVGFAVMCSRVLGLIREQVFAFFFGAGYAYDSFVVAFRIPNLLRDLFGEGALSAAFVAVFPTITPPATRSRPGAWPIMSWSFCPFPEPADPAGHLFFRGDRPPAGQGRV